MSDPTPNSTPTTRASINTPITADLVQGAVEFESTELGLSPHRLPRWAREQFPEPQLLAAEEQTSGVRLSFRTSATVIELEARPTKRFYLGAPPRPDGLYDLYVDGVAAGRGSIDGGNVRTIDMATGTVTDALGDPERVGFSDLPAGNKQIELWLPHNEPTELVALHTDAPVEGTPDPPRLRWLHYGSSISQGSDAASPSTTWPAEAARRAGVGLTNLGFSGSAMLDPIVARVIRDQPADVISLKVGINIVNGAVMRLRAFVPAIHGFLDAIRDGHPTTPVLVISPIWCHIHEDVPGPSDWDMTALAEGRLGFRAGGDPEAVPQGALTIGVIRDLLAGIVAARATDDPHLHYLDGQELYGKDDYAQRPLPDELHPDPATHLSMGERFAARAFGDDGPFAF